MRIAITVLFLVTASMFLTSGIRTLRALHGEVDTKTKDFLERLRLSPALYRMTGALEVLAALGLVAGLVVLPLGIAAAAGLTVLMLGAIAYHLRAGDPPVELLFPGVPLALSAAAFTVGLAAL